MKTRIYCLFGSLLLSAALLGHWSVGVRFINPAYNYYVFAMLILSTPVAAYWLAYLIKSRVYRIGLKLLSALALAPTAVIALIAVLDAPPINSNDDPSSELISTVRPSGREYYRLYRTNCGATCAYGLMLQREYETPVGIKVVKSIWSEYRESEGFLRLSEQGELEVVSNGETMFTYQP